MPEKPWYAHYEGDYRLKTWWFHCSAQDGIYRSIIAALNMHGPLQNDERVLRALCRSTPEEWAEHWPKIRDEFLFTNDDGLLDQKRAETERRKAGRINKKLSNAGKEGAKKRWEKEKSKKKPAAAMPDDVPQAVALYNEMARRAGLLECQDFTDTRKRQIAARLKSAGGLEGWKVALEKIENSDFCKGDNDRGWKAGIDFLCQASSFTKLMEGSYDHKRPARTKREHPASNERSRRREILEGLGLRDLDARGTPAREPVED